MPTVGHLPSARLLAPGRPSPQPHAARSVCRGAADASLHQQALSSPDDGVRHWGVTELVRARPRHGGTDAARCSLLAAFVRAGAASDHHALLDAVNLYGVSPRMLPVFQELMASPSAAVRLRAAPLWSTLIGLYRVAPKDMGRLVPAAEPATE